MNKKEIRFEELPKAVTNLTQELSEIKSLLTQRQENEKNSPKSPSAIDDFLNIILLINQFIKSNCSISVPQTIGLYHHSEQRLERFHIFGV